MLGLQNDRRQFEGDSLVQVLRLFQGGAKKGEKQTVDCKQYCQPFTIPPCSPYEILGSVTSSCLITSGNVDGLTGTKPRIAVIDGSCRGGDQLHVATVWARQCPLATEIICYYPPP